MVRYLYLIVLQVVLTARIFLLGLAVINGVFWGEFQNKGSSLLLPPLYPPIINLFLKLI